MKENQYEVSQLTSRLSEQDTFFRVLCLVKAVRNNETSLLSIASLILGEEF